MSICVAYDGPMGPGMGDECKFERPMCAVRCERRKRDPDWKPPLGWKVTSSTDEAT